MNFKFNIKKIIAILGLIFFVILLHWNTYNMPFERDEGEYAYGAKVLLDGGLPYRDAFMQKPPLILYTYALGQVLTGEKIAVWPPRVLLGIAIFGIALLVGYIVKKEGAENTSITSMYLIVLMLSLPQLYALSANTEIFMLLPLVSAVAIFIKFKNKCLSSSTATISAGFLITTALLYKPISLFVIIFFVLYWLWEVWQKDKSVKEVFWVFIKIFLGCLTSAVIFLGYFLIIDQGKSLWENTFVYNMYYIQKASDNTHVFFYLLGVFMSKWYVICILLLISFFAKTHNKWFYLGLFITSMLVVFDAPFVHYAIIIMPFWVILAMLGLNSVVTHLVKNIQKNYYFWNASKFIKAKVLLVTTVGFLAIVTMLFETKEQFFKTPNEMSAFIYANARAPFLESKITAEKLISISKKDDYVYILGSEPQILYYADRKSSSRFVITYPLTINTEVQLGYQKEVVSELEKKEPEAIVVSSLTIDDFNKNEVSKDFMSYMNNLLENNYMLEGGYVIDQVTKQGAWKENLGETEKPKASLLLYKKK